MDLVTEAIIFATNAHDGMRRKKGTIPYIVHPMEAAVIVASITEDQELISAAVLHDVVEDADVDIEEIEKRFGKRVRELVESETEDKRADLPPTDTWRLRKEESIETLRRAKDPAVLIVWLGDKLANMRSMYRDWRVEGDKMWQRFNQKDTSQQKWYYTTIAELTSSLSDTDAWQEYKYIVDAMFGKGN